MSSSTPSEGANQQPNDSGRFRHSNVSNDSFDLESTWDQHLQSPPGYNESVLGKIRYFVVDTIYKSYISPNAGISLLILSQFFNSIMVTTCKLLVTDKDFNTPIHPLQILFVRMAITYICCLLYMVLTRSVPHAPFGPKELRWLLALRGFVGFFGVFGLYYSLQYLSLSDAVAITFLIPMVTGFLAWILLHERYSLLEGICSIISLGGVILIAKPHFIFGKESDNETSSVDESVESSSTEKRLLATGVGLIGVLGASSVYIVLRKIGKAAHPLLSVSYFALTCCVITFVAILVIPSLQFVLPTNSYQWVLFCLIGFSGFFMQFSLTAGIQRVRAAKASLMSYTNMVFALIWDLTIWGHLPGFLSFLGIILIIGNAVIIIKYKPGDDESGTPHSGANDLENAEVKYSAVAGVAETISLQDFVIEDDEEEEEERVDEDGKEDEAEDVDKKQNVRSVELENGSGSEEGGKSDS
ncbi:EamA-like transporter family-domain-containing protein [Scheffersomyces xylosifermentans]|uniref:EamA-like transporter family-domain-containing protein n=1 Tax=Scheffersomyces xylosifermentans TaxID=1304137 RepID=UPI00315DAD20